MGLDAVELILDLENKLEIWLPEHEMSKVRTVGELYDLVLKTNEAKAAPDVCANVVVALRASHALQEITGKPRKVVVLDTPLHDLLSVSGRQKAWTEFEKRLRLPLPSLKWPMWFRITFCSIAALPFALIPLLAPFSLTNDLGLSPFLFLLYFGPALLVSLLLMILLGLCSKSGFFPVALLIPHKCQTLRDLVRTLVEKHKVTIVQSQPKLSPEEIWDVVRKTVAEIANVKPEKITRESRIVEDLGLG